MVLTYLRRSELIAPDYPNGLRSRIREAAIMDAIACEGHAKHAMDQMTLHAFMLPILTQSAREEHVTKMVELLTASQCYSDLDRRKAKSALKTEARKTASEIYEILKKYNYWDDRPDFTPAQYREIINRINELKKETDGPTVPTD